MYVSIIIVLLFNIITDMEIEGNLNRNIENSFMII